VYNVNPEDYRSELVFTIADDVTSNEVHDIETYMIFC